MGNSICLFILIVAIISVRASAKKNKMPSKRTNQDMQMESFDSRRNPSDNRSLARKYAEKRKEERIERKTASKTASRTTAKTVKNKTINKEEPQIQTKISERVETQHDGYDRSIIHQNSHKDIEMNSSNQDLAMETIKELIVCGYPTEIPGQRDFVKEGEEFLANLGAGNSFF